MDPVTMRQTLSFTSPLRGGRSAKRSGWGAKSPMTQHQLGTVIARREFECDGSTVILEVGTPYPVDNGGTWFCPYRIFGLGEELVRRAGGVDSAQALVGALQMAAAHLYAYAETNRAKLTWCGQLNLGLPVPKGIEDIVPPDGK